MSGNKQPSKKHKSIKFRKIIAAFSYLLLILTVVSTLSVLSLRFMNPATWSLKIERQFFPPPNYPHRIEQRWVKRSEIAAVMQLAVIASEDQRFPDHWGFDINSMIQAVKSRNQGRRLRGASTITQQTAKNLILWPGRSWLRKGLEAGFTVLLELFLDKSRILELYLNIIEFGPGIIGVEAASQHYYLRPASQLTKKQAATLAAVLPNPYRLHVLRPDAYVRSRVTWIIRQLKNMHN